MIPAAILEAASFPKKLNEVFQWPLARFLTPISTPKY
jgi:hypothetical protein